MLICTEGRGGERGLGDKKERELSGVLAAAVTPVRVRGHMCSSARKEEMAIEASKTVTETDQNGRRECDPRGRGHKCAVFVCTKGRGGERGL